MPHLHRLLLPLATAALLSTGTAHAEARRSAQSLPAAVRLSAPASTRVGVISPVRTNRGDDARQAFARSRSDGREDLSSRGRGGRQDEGRDDRGRFDNRRHQGPRDWHEYEKGKNDEGHHFGHHDRDDDHGHGHDRDDSPGC